MAALLEGQRDHDWMLSSVQSAFYRMVATNAAGCTDVCRVGVIGLDADEMYFPSAPRLVVTHRCGETSAWGWIRTTPHQGIDDATCQAIERLAEQLTHE